MSTDQEFIESPQDLLEEKSNKDRKPPSSAFTAFLERFEKVGDLEEKIRISIEFMREALSQTGSPRYKDFWEGRRLCLPLFKENITPKGRAELWASYIELSSEARRLKEILDEQSAFAAEQIELAIQALELDLENYDSLLQQIPSIAFPDPCDSLEKKIPVYNALQRELNLLNALASRINAMRKEVVKTEMRIRIKNKFFERLSICGDRVFPRRKELIKTISDEFNADVEHFIQDYFCNDTQKVPPLYILRDEIKALQATAKQLTLNTQIFTETRLKLSECWDKIKNFEKERKKEFAQKKQVYKENSDLVLEKIKAFSESCALETATNEEANVQVNALLDFMQTVELGRDEVRYLKDEIQLARKPIYDRAREQTLERERKEKEFENQKKDKMASLRTEIAQLLQNMDAFDQEGLTAERDRLMREFELLGLTKAEKQVYERSFKQLKDAINEKKEKAIMALSEDDIQALEQLKVILKQRQEQRQEIKSQIETYRKALGGSGLDFEKGLLYRELMETEKAELEKVNATIQEIEEKIDLFSG
jgi:hypothetical protein